MTAFYSKKNNALSKIATVGGIDAVTDPVTFAVTTGEGSKFPASNFPITIDNEILLCTSRTGDNLTCARAKESTTIAAHSQNADVEARITAAALEEYEKISNLHGMDYAADGGSTDAYAITLAPAPTAYFAGMVIKFKANTANTGAATIDVNALGAKTIKKNVSSDLATNDILANQIVTLIYDGTNFQIVAYPAATPTPTLLSSKMITFTRDAAAASGDVAYTGVGFQPTSILALMCVSGDTKISIALSDSAKSAQGIHCSANNVFRPLDDILINFSNGVDAAQSCVIKSLDADGFTLTWTKFGTPTGTMSCRVICFR